MPSNLGYMTWATGDRYARDQFRLDGREYTRPNTNFLNFNTSWEPVIAPQINALGTGGTQSVAIGGDQPANLRSRIFDVEINPNDADEYEQILASLQKNELVDFMPGIWSIDRWHLNTANASPTTWKTSRGIWLGSPVDTAVYAPHFWKRDSAGADTDWTVVHSGTPGASEAKFPAASSTTPFDVETAALDETEDSELWARYMGIFWVQITNPTESAGVNDLSVQFQATEVLIGDYTGLA